MFSINCKGKLHQFDRPIIMAILNATTDSFYQGNLHQDYVKLVGQMIADGATIIDIGGQSTNPNSALLNAEDEAKNLLPVLAAVRKAFPSILISVDTFYSHVAIAAVAAGADIVNDVSAGEMDTKMIEQIAKLKVPYILMHMQGTAQSMQVNPSYTNIAAEVYQYLYNKVQLCVRAGITDLMIDVGFGFGKTIAHNYSLLKHLSYFKLMNLPILAGLSRKSMIYKTINGNAAAALNGTTALHMLALSNGASILRVHDVKEAKECVDLFEAYEKAP